MGLDKVVPDKGEHSAAPRTVPAQRKENCHRKVIYIGIKNVDLYGFKLGEYSRGICYRYDNDTKVFGMYVLEFFLVKHTSLTIAVVNLNLISFRKLRTYVMAKSKLSVALRLSLDSLCWQVSLWTLLASPTLDSVLAAHTLNCVGMFRIGQQDILENSLATMTTR